MEVYGFRNQITEIKKKYNGSAYSGILAQLTQLPDDVADLEISRDSVYYLVFEEHEYLKPFIVNHDRAVYITRVRRFRENGKCFQKCKNHQ